MVSGIGVTRRPAEHDHPAARVDELEGGAAGGAADAVESECDRPPGEGSADGVGPAVGPVVDRPRRRRGGLSATTATLSAPPAVATTVAPTALTAWTSRAPSPPAAAVTRATSPIAHGSDLEDPQRRSPGADHGHSVGSATWSAGGTGRPHRRRRGWRSRRWPHRGGPRRAGRASCFRAGAEAVDDAGDLTAGRHRECRRGQRAEARALPDRRVDQMDAARLRRRCAPGRRAGEGSGSSS